MELPGYVFLIDGYPIPQSYILLYGIYRKEKRCYDGYELGIDEVKDVCIRM
jgi:hypothetical protein